MDNCLIGPKELTKPDNKSDVKVNSKVNSTVILEVYIIVPDDDLTTISNELLNHVKLSREEAGCLAFDVVQDTTISNRFNVYEQFNNRAAFEFHQKRVKNSYWGMVTQNVSRHYQITGFEKTA